MAAHCTRTWPTGTRGHKKRVIPSRSEESGWWLPSRPRPDPSLRLRMTRPCRARSEDERLLLLARRRLRCGRCTLVEALDHRIGDVDRIGRVDETRLELVEDHGQTHLFSDGIDDRLDLSLERRELAVARLAHFTIGILRETLHRDLLVRQLLRQVGKLL